jgi:hypothetical protein
MEPMETAIWSVPARHWMIIDRRGYSSLLILLYIMLLIGVIHALGV